MSLIAPQPGILDIALYEGGESRLPGVAHPVKLSSNENPYGPGAAARAAFGATADGLHLYPSTDHRALREAIGAVLGLDSGRIVCGAGSDEILAFLCQAYAGPGDEVLHTAHGFLMYAIYARSVGATPVAVPERDRRVDVEALLGAVTARTRLVFLANPANPTGTMLRADELQRLADGLPGSALLVLDGAYAEYADGYDGGAALVERHDSVVMTRTFSKIHGLGGLRVGWGYGPRAVIDVLNRVRGPFNLGAPQLAAAEAAIRDRGHVTRCRALNARLRAELRDALIAAGVACDAPEANFVLARFGDAEEAGACEAHLRRAGLLVRRVGAYGFPEALRITVGDRDACARVAEAVAEFRA